MYELYHDKNKHEIRIKPLRNLFDHVRSQLNETPLRYNDYYWFCTARKPLVELAKKIKDSWIGELEESLDRVNKIDIGEKQKKSIQLYK